MQCASSKRINKLKLLHDRTGHGNESMLIESHAKQLVEGMKIDKKDLRRHAHDDKAPCDVCVRAKITRLAFKKIHKIRGKKLGDYISCDLAVFVNCESKMGYKYVAAFVDHATKYCWVYAMKSRDEFDGIIEDLIEVQLRALKVSIKHYHADGGAEFISKKVLKLLKSTGTTYSWNPADTPELNATSERKFRTLNERCLCMLACCYNLDCQ